MFPVSQISLDLSSSQPRRHHLHALVRQRAGEDAARTIELTKPATRHTRCHASATHLPEDGCDILTTQEFLGLRDVKMTIIDPHVLNGAGKGFTAPSTVSEAGRRHHGVRMLGCAMLRPNIRQTELDGDAQGC